MTEQHGLIPRSCALLEGFTPTSGDNPSTQGVATYALGWELPIRWRFDSALRYATANEDGAGFIRWGPSVLLRLPVNERAKIHAESFTVFSAGREQNVACAFFSPGTQVLVTPNLELGLRVGWGLTDEAARFFVDGSFGWRF